MRLQFTGHKLGVPVVWNGFRNDWNDLTRKPATMRDQSLFAESGTTERRPPFGPPLKGGPRGVGPAPSAPAESNRDEAARWVRENLPVCSAVADAFRAAFPGVRLTYASENGHRIGKPLEAPEYCVSGDDLMPLPTRARA